MMWAAQIHRHCTGNTVDSMLMLTVLRLMRSCRYVLNTSKDDVQRLVRCHIY